MASLCSGAAPQVTLPMVAEFTVLTLLPTRGLHASVLCVGLHKGQWCHHQCL